VRTEDEVHAEIARLKLIQENALRKRNTDFIGLARINEAIRVLEWTLGGGYRVGVMAREGVE
jgi:hypothetical protein